VTKFFNKLREGFFLLINNLNDNVIELRNRMMSKSDHVKGLFQKFRGKEQVSRFSTVLIRRGEEYLIFFSCIFSIFQSTKDFCSARISEEHLLADKVEGKEEKLNWISGR